jgi:hypothetical protein
VGREEQIDLLRTALREQEPPFNVLHVYAPGGVGKTTLLGAYAVLAADANVPAFRLDGRGMEPSPDGFLTALRQAMGLHGRVSALKAVSRAPRSVILIDNYEALAPLDDWLRESFLPQMPAQTLIVTAGRNPPSPAWRTEAGWQELVRIVQLRNLPPEDSRAYLRAREVPEIEHTAILDFTHGHPLALALIADVLKRGAKETFSPEQAPDVIRVLLERFVQQVPGNLHRRALEISARARVTSEALLADALGREEAPALFAWLRDLSFMEQGPEGLAPHDLAREVLDTDLRWRDPDGFRDLHARVLRSLVSRLATRSGTEQQRAYFDIVYLSRNSPLMRPYYDWQTMGKAYAEPASPADFKAILEMVRRHEGKASDQIARYWLNRQPEAFLSFRGRQQKLVGFTALLLLDSASAEDRTADPAMTAVWKFVDKHGPLRSGERLMYHRFVMGNEEYQDLGTLTLVAAVATVRWLTTPRLAWSFPVMANPDARERHFEAVGFARARDADFQVGSHRYGVFAHDWRVEPPMAWIERKGQLDPAVEPPPAARDWRPRRPLLVLSRPDFEASVRHALRDFTRPGALAGNPLIHSRVVADQADGAPTAAALQRLIIDAAGSLRANPRDEKLYRALQHTYFEPAPTQEQAAELLGLPFSTYRYHLTRGIARVAAELWQRELSGVA